MTTEDKDTKVPAASKSPSDKSATPATPDLLDELEAMDTKAKEQGHSLVAVLNHAAQSAFGIDLA